MSQYFNTCRIQRAALVFAGLLLLVVTLAGTTFGLSGLVWCATLGIEAVLALAFMRSLRWENTLWFYACQQAGRYSTPKESPKDLALLVANRGDIDAAESLLVWGLKKLTGDVSTLRSLSAEVASVGLGFQILEERDASGRPLVSLALTRSGSPFKRLWFYV